MSDQLYMGVHGGTGPMRLHIALTIPDSVVNAGSTINISTQRKT